MNFLHSDFNGGPQDMALVQLSSQANVMLLDDANFANYRRGRSFNYFGGWATTSPIRLQPPRQANWHVVVDLGGYGGQVRASVQVLKRTSDGSLI